MAKNINKREHRYFLSEKGERYHWYVVLLDDEIEQERRINLTLRDLLAKEYEVDLTQSLDSEKIRLVISRNTQTGTEVMVCVPVTDAVLFSDFRDGRVVLFDGQFSPEITTTPSPAYVVGIADLLLDR